MRTDLTTWLRTLITCDPVEAPYLLEVFSDFVDECGDEERADLVRAIVAKGPVDVEPVRPDAFSYRDFDFIGYYPIMLQGVRCKHCESVYSPWRDDRYFGGECGVCRKYTAWALICYPDEAAREMLHRLRVRCLVLWREEMPSSSEHSKECGTKYRGCAPGCPKDTLEKALHVDPRWPPLPCPRCEATMTRCERCGAEWCIQNFCVYSNALNFGKLNCPECGNGPTRGTVQFGVDRAWYNEP